ncbi:DUF3995 domain-containing protein [Ktedonosporobacter rubrisoli]|uniref:DUF3995 domain-containing protein n=1 Tax=Ktedonosporobacter rubrisoli TaxID=2509675 RepID=A0A4V0YYA5_KTERU|nr:DUF3995 domain-containing protein [Ktedonosporobacter rubrisoli]QBD75541.1 DUF3995 domain-containing protein [Ktedonosporobacter rubrisoli]
MTKNPLELAHGSALELPRLTRWLGYVTCIWSFLFAVMHFYWGIEMALTGKLTLPGMGLGAGARSVPPPRDVSLSAIAATIAIMVILSVVVVLLRFRGPRMPRMLQFGIMGLGAVALTAYVVYSFIINGIIWVLACGVICAVGAVIALALIQAWGRIIPRWLLLVPSWLGGMILLVHTLYGGCIQVLAMNGVISWQQVQILAGAPVDQAPTMQQGVHMTIQNLLIWDPWFTLGGLLFCLLAWQARHWHNVSPHK